LEEWLEVSSQYFHQPRLLWEDLSDDTIAKHLTLREQSGEDSAIVMAGDLQNGFSHHWFTMQSQEDIGLLVFHSYEPILAVAGEHTIELWHTDDQRRMTSFSPSLVQRSPIKSMAFLNENQELNHFTLMVTLCDGVVRIFHGQSASADGQDQFHATAAFRSMETSHCDSAVVTTWSQARNELSIASGSSSSMQIWDAQQQRCTRTISINRTRLESVLTCLDVEPERGNIFLSGDSAGVVTMYDQRQRRQPAIKFWDDNNSSVSLCTLGAGLEKEIVSVS
jgi:WD40 repeat protein